MMKPGRWLRPTEALVGGGGRYDYASLGDEEKNTLVLDGVEDDCCLTCGFWECNCPSEPRVEWHEILGVAHTPAGCFVQAAGEWFALGPTGCYPLEARVGSTVGVRDGWAVGLCGKMWSELLPLQGE